jgi:hypothetical protein
LLDRPRQFSQRLCSGLLILSQGTHRQSVPNGADQSSLVEVRSCHAIAGSSLDDLRDPFFVRILAQKDETYRHFGVQRLGYQVDCLSVSGFVLEHNQAIGLVP